MMELVDMRDLGSRELARRGSNPRVRTICGIQAGAIMRKSLCDSQLDLGR